MFVSAPVCDLSWALPKSHKVAAARGERCEIAGAIAEAMKLKKRRSHNDCLAQESPKRPVAPLNPLKSLRPVGLFAALSFSDLALRLQTACRMSFRQGTRVVKTINRSNRTRTAGKRSDSFSSGFLYAGLGLRPGSPETSRRSICSMSAARLSRGQLMRLGIAAHRPYLFQ